MTGLIRKFQQWTRRRADRRNQQEQAQGYEWALTAFYTEGKNLNEIRAMCDQGIWRKDYFDIGAYLAVMKIEYQHNKPPPGSDEALDLGCRCPVLDNAHGKGYMGRRGEYIYTVGCPVHYLAPESPEPYISDREEKS